MFNIINDDEYVIQGRGLPFSDEDIVPLGIEIKSSGNYSIAFENADGLFSNQVQREHKKEYAYKMEW